MEPSNKNFDTNLFLFEFRLQCMVKTFVHQPKTLSSLYYGILSGNLQCIYTCAEFRYTLTPVWLLYVHYFIDGFLHFRVVVLDKITDYVLFLSKLLVTASVGKFMQQCDLSPKCINSVFLYWVIFQLKNNFS